MYIKDGRTWIPYQMYHSYGVSKLNMPWIAYCKVTGMNSTILIASKLGVNEDRKHLTIQGREYEVVSSNETEITLAEEEPYLTMWYGKYEEGRTRCVRTYTQTAFDFDLADNQLWYDSERELIIDICNRLRQEFGNEFNLNDYLFPSIILDDPMVNVDILEAGLLYDMND